MKHFWQFLIIAINWKYVRRRPIRFVTAPRVGAFHSPAIFAVLHWSFVFKHQTLLCCCLILETISVGRKSKDCIFWWRSLHEVNTSRRCVLDDQWRRYTNYSCTHIAVDGPLLAYAYPGLYWHYSRMSIRVNTGLKQKYVSHQSSQQNGILLQNYTKNQICTGCMIWNYLKQKQKKDQ